MTVRLPITAMVLTFNEEVNLPECLDSLGACDEIIVVDSGSTDRTTEIAIQAGARIIEHAFTTHSAQWNWALQTVAPRNAWVLGIDADQRLTAELIDELRKTFAKPPQDVSGFFIPRRQMFRGRWIRHGGYYPKYLLKLFRIDKVHVDTTDLLDHHFTVNGPTRLLESDLIEENHKENDILFWLAKHLRYADLMAHEELGKASLDADAGDPFGNPDQRTAWLKSVWRRWPRYTRSFIYFLYRYFVRLGFLDGKEGFVFHFMQAFWFRLVVDVRMDELMRENSAHTRN